MNDIALLYRWGQLIPPLFPIANRRIPGLLRGPRFESKQINLGLLLGTQMGGGKDATGLLGKECAKQKQEGISFLFLLY